MQIWWFLCTHRLLCRGLASHKKEVLFEMVFSDPRSAAQLVFRRPDSCVKHQPMVGQTPNTVNFSWIQSILMSMGVRAIFGSSFPSSASPWGRGQGGTAENRSKPDRHQHKLYPREVSSMADLSRRASDSHPTIGDVFSEFYFGGPNGPFPPETASIEVGGFAPHLDR